MFLAQMEPVVPWAALLALMAPLYHPEGRPGRKSLSYTVLLRVHLMQQWYALTLPPKNVSLVV